MADTTLLTLIEDVASMMGALEQGTWTATSTTALTAANYPFKTNRTDASNRTYEGVEILSTSGATAVPNPNSASGYAASTGIFTPSVDYTTKPDATATFDLFLHGLGRRILVRNVNKALRERYYTLLSPLTLVADGDFETTGTSSWGTAVNATFTKVTSSGNVLRGKQAGRVLNSVANGYLPSTTIYVDQDDGNQYYLEAKVRADVGTVRLQAYDVTNSAAIDGAETHARRGWGKLAFSFTLPTDCEAIQVRLVGDDATSDGYWDDVILLRTGATEVPLPAAVEEEFQVRHVYTDDPEQLQHDVAMPTEYPWWKVLPNESNPNNMFNLMVWPPVYGPIWVEIARPFPALTADADTTFAPREWLAQAALVYTLKEMIASQPKGRERWADQLRREERVLRSMDGNRAPNPIITRWNTPPNTPIPEVYR